MSPPANYPEQVERAQKMTSTQCHEVSSEAPAMRAFSGFSAIPAGCGNVLAKAYPTIAAIPATGRTPCLFQFESGSLTGQRSSRFRSPSFTLARLAAQQPLSFKHENESSLPYPGSTNGTVSPQAPTTAKRWEVTHVTFPYPAPAWKSESGQSTNPNLTTCALQNKEKQ